MTAKDHEIDVPYGIAHTVAVRIAAIARIEEQDVEAPLLHSFGQAAHVQFRREVVVGIVFDEFILAARLAAFHGDDAVARSDEAVGDALHGDQGPYCLHPVGIARQTASQPEDGFGALADSFSQGDNVCGGNTRGGSDFFRSEGFHSLDETLESFGLGGDVLFVVETFFDEESEHAHCQYSVGSRPDEELLFRQVAGVGATAVDVDDAGSIRPRLGEPLGVRRQGFGDVRPPEQEEFRIHELVDGCRRVGGAEHHGQCV